MPGKNKPVDITATFGADLCYGGAVSIPRMLLENYNELGINDLELVLLLHIIRFRQLAGLSYPSVEELSEPMAADRGDVRRLLASLMEKGVLRIQAEYSEKEEDFVQAYSLAPLFEKLSELWACRKLENLQRAKENLAGKKMGQVAVLREKPVALLAARLVKSLEQEFGRPLSPIEIEQVKNWADQDHYGEDIILEALKRAVLLGKLNFRYIDSILLEWSKKGLHSVAAIKKYEAGFRERQAAQPKGPQPKGARPAAQGKGKGDSKRKELLKMLYMS